MKMKITIQSALAILVLLWSPSLSFAQAPTMGTVSDFVLFSADGSVSNSGISQLTGNVGTNNGSSTGFGNVNGGMHDGDAASIQCAADLLIAYNQLAAAIPTLFPAPLLGNGAILTPGVYSIPSAATMNLDLVLDAQGDPNAVFIFQINGSFSMNPGAKVKLVNSAMACNVYWKVEGLVSIAAGCTMRGSIFANNAAIEMNTNDTLEGRALSTAGAVTIDGVLAYTPIGCGSPVLTGPVAPDLGTAACYAIFSGSGAVTNAGITTINGDVGTNVGLTTGFDSLLVNGTIHPIPDVSTANCAADLAIVYSYLNLLPYDIELLYPAQFGRNLVLTPHSYLMNAAVTFTDTLYLNGLGNPDAVFVIQINGAMSTSTFSKVLLTNGTQAKNVYWKIDGAVSIFDNSIFCGTIVCNNGALGVLNPGVVLDGRAFTTSGALNTNAIATTSTAIPGNCTTLSAAPEPAMVSSIVIFPNPFQGSFTVRQELVMPNTELCVYNSLGAILLRCPLTEKVSPVASGSLIPGIYFYQILVANQPVQSGRLVSLK